MYHTGEVEGGGWGVMLQDKTLWSKSRLIRLRNILLPELLKTCSCASRAETKFRSGNCDQANVSSVFFTEIHVLCTFCLQIHKIPNLSVCPCIFGGIMHTLCALTASTRQAVSGRRAPVCCRWGEPRDGHDGGSLVRPPEVPPGSRQGAEARRLPGPPELHHGHGAGVWGRLQRAQWHLQRGTSRIDKIWMALCIRGN